MYETDDASRHSRFSQMHSLSPRSTFVENHRPKTVCLACRLEAPVGGLCLRYCFAAASPAVCVPVSAAAFGACDQSGRHFTSRIVAVKFRLNKLQNVTRFVLAQHNINTVICIGLPSQIRSSVKIHKPRAASFRS